MNYTPNLDQIKKADLQRAIKNLEIAKKLNRPVRFAKSGECDFTRSMEIKKNISTNKTDYVTMDEACELLGIKPYTFRVKRKTLKIPYITVNRKRLYKKEEILKHVKK